MRDKLTSPYSKLIKSVEIGVNELRMKDSSGAYRVFYYLKTQKGIFIFHAFKKKTKTSKDLAKALELSPADAVEWELRYNITNKIIETVRKKKLTVTEVAKKAGTSRARITKVLKGDSIGISLDTLVKIVAVLDQTIRVNFKKIA